MHHFPPAGQKDCMTGDCSLYFLPLTKLLKPFKNMHRIGQRLDHRFGFGFWFKSNLDQCKSRIKKVAFFDWVLQPTLSNLRSKKKKKNKPLKIGRNSVTWVKDSSKDNPLTKKKKKIQFLRLILIRCLCLSWWYYR